MNEMRAIEWVKLTMIVAAIVTAGWIARADIHVVISSQAEAHRSEHSQILREAEATRRAIYLETAIRALPQEEQTRMVPWLLEKKVDPEDASEMRARIRRKFLEYAPERYGIMQDQEARGVVKLPPKVKLPSFQLDRKATKGSSVVPQESQ